MLGASGGRTLLSSWRLPQHPLPLTWHMAQGNVLGVRWPAVRGLGWKASLSPLCGPHLMVGLLKLYL